MARLGVPVGGRVKKLRAVEDQSAPIPEEITSELGRGRLANFFVTKCSIFLQTDAAGNILRVEVCDDPWER